MRPLYRRLLWAGLCVISLSAVAVIAAYHGCNFTGSGPIPKRSAFVDATPINRTRNLHHFFTDSPEFFDDLYRQLLSPEDLLSRRLHVIRPTERRT